MARRIDLRENWTLRAAGGEGVPARVAAADVPARTPGCVHTDLLAAGLIPAPYVGDSEDALSWIGRTDWRYRTVLPADGLAGAERVDLVCEGLDTVADLALDGQVIGRTRNMHREYRLALATGASGDGGPPAGRELAITFASPYRHAERLRAELGDRPAAYPQPYPFIRKMACNFGWDWGPVLVTAGIWRPIWLHAWSTARLARVRPEVTVAAGPGGRAHGRVVLHVDVERAASGARAPLTVEAEVAGERTRTAVPPGEGAVRLELAVPEPRLWWPRGYGEQVRYPLTVTLRSAGAELDAWRRDIGFRSVELDTAPDDDGTPFTLMVNGARVLVRGANWIPDDCFPSRVGPGRYRQRVDQATGAGINLLRVWGGGVYESGGFYEACDERGVLVWQDFLFACAAYPEEPPLAEEVEAEARQAVVRLMPHPSLVLWNGNNENIWGHADWGWRDRLGDRSWGAGYYFDLLPRVVAELDPTRPYWPGSPYSGRPDLHPNDPAHGNTHIWDVWNERDYPHYRAYRPRFVAEFGYQGPPAHATLRRALGDGPLDHASAAMTHRQRARDGVRKLADGLRWHFPEPDGFDDWHYLAQVNQARAITLGVGHFRSLWPLCSGAVVWQLNDCWPVISWAAVDGDARRKPLWYALRRVYADRLLVLGPADGGGLELALCNDTDRAWRPAVAVARHDLAGPVLAREKVSATVPPRAVVRLPVPARVAQPADTAREFVTADSGTPADRAVWFFAEDTEVAYPAPRFETEVTERGGDLRVAVTARTPLRDLALFADRLAADAEADDMLLTLLPGETHTFTVAGGAGLDHAAAVRPPVLRCVNEAVRAGRVAHTTPG
ncbi:glycoside hydrolase family 2 protein [Marinitenerispora sediminis]|uniref:beta-mannosidase n=1 Tax=Marinitenerispora sediminis TaxID=1931232 RepID=A0A368TEM9_9ACTN|nr:glycoside hydrolase family 2 protein [Marinitenerispora sediminis]RCV50097.1 beta-mannosidase [Marinitenerispora sediminis]RCV54466.1 beta-mannosidase [Marinitenerispora sediminis]RCV62477.1 beta-mannosidase [Marinitenerispora sediminis]